MMRTSNPPVLPGWRRTLGRIRHRRMVQMASRALIGLCLMVTGLYGAIIVFMLHVEPKLVYFPARPDQEWHDKPDRSIQDITLRTSDGAMHGWYCAPENPDAAFLICHGNAGNLSIRGKSLLQYRDRLNGAVLIFDYPGYGLSEGEPSERGCYESADAAYDWLVNEKGFKPENIVICGESLGGGIAVDLAARRSCGGLILVNTFGALPTVAQRRYRWLPVELLMSNRFDSLAKIERIRGPLLVTHGGADDIIPPSDSRQLFDLATCKKEYWVRDGKGHFDPFEAEDLDFLHDYFVRHQLLPAPKK